MRERHRYSYQPRAGQHQEPTIESAEVRSDSFNNQVIHDLEEVNEFAKKRDQLDEFEQELTAFKDKVEAMADLKQGK